jgi:hypothetical protein
MLCSWCSQKALNNNFVVGTHNLQHSTLTEHLKDSGHVSIRDEFLTPEEKLALNAPTEDSKPITSFFKSKRLNHTFELMKSTFHNVYWLIKENLPLHKALSLHGLGELNGIEIAQHYRDHHSAKEMMECMSQTIEQKTLDQLKNSNLIGICVDSSTDISLRENMAITLKYLSRDEGSVGKIFECFLELTELKSKKAEDLHAVLIKCLESKDLLNKLTAFGSDGESALRAKNGVAGKLKDAYPYTVSVHCVAHRLALGSSSLVKGCIELNAINNMLHTLVNFFGSSPKRIQTLKDAEKDFQQDDLKLLHCIDTRWLSNFACVERVIKIYNPLIAALTEMSDLTVAAGLLAQLTRFKIVGLLHAFADILSNLSRCMKIFQNNSLTLWKNMETH